MKLYKNTRTSSFPQGIKSADAPNLFALEGTEIAILSKTHKNTDAIYSVERGTFTISGASILQNELPDTSIVVTLLRSKHPFDEKHY
jgi:hypothetical protein